MIAKERLYRWLNNATFVEDKGCSHPLDVLAVAIGCTERTVIRSVKELEAEGRIRVKRPKVRGRANTYWVDCWNPSKRCPVLAVLAGGRAEVGRRRTLKHQAELSRLARRASCHPNENSRPSRAQTPGVDPFLAEAVVDQRCGREAKTTEPNPKEQHSWTEGSDSQQQQVSSAPSGLRTGSSATTASSPSGSDCSPQPASTPSGSRSRSATWSTRGRMAWQHDRVRLCGTEHKGSCANCMPWALRWRDRVIDQAGLFAEAA